VSKKTTLDQDPVLAEIVGRLVAEFSPRQIILFGSRARGDASEGSDYDILVVVPMTSEPGIRLAQQAHRNALRGIPAPVDVLFFTQEKFDENKTVIGTLPELAVHEGKVLYAA